MKKKQIKEIEYDIGLLIMGLIGGLFLSLSATAIYDFFMKIMEIKGATNIEIMLMSLMFIIGPFACAFYLFKKILDDLKKEGAKK